MLTEELYLALGKGETASLRDTEVTFKATSEREGGCPTVLEFITAPGFSTGDDVHSKIEEIFYVVDGEITIRAGEWSGQIGPGGLVPVPPGTPHGFGNAGSAPATLLLIISSAGVHEEYFRELAAILAHPGPPNSGAIGDFRDRYDTQQLSGLRSGPDPQ